MRQIRLISGARLTIAAACCALLLALAASAQTLKPVAPAAAAKVTQIDAEGLKKLLKPNGKPLLVNFWATWCDPCRDEFPDLVKIDAEYKGRIDFLTVSLDDVEDKDTAVPKFLAEMKAEMPVYLLITPDEGAAILSVNKDWTGGLPFTILYNEKGEQAYFRQGKIRVDILKEALTKTVAASPNVP